MRRIDDDLAAIADGRFQLVHALGRRPDVVVHRRHDREHALEWLFHVDDVLSGREVCRRRLGRSWRTGVQARQPVAFCHQAKARARARALEAMKAASGPAYDVFFPPEVLVDVPEGSKLLKEIGNKQYYETKGGDILVVDTNG